MSRHHHRLTHGRHRLGLPGLTHCTEFAMVTQALSAHRKGWLSAFVIPARHKLAGRRRGGVAPERRWAPVLAH